MDDRLYFRITERPDSRIFDPGWFGIDADGLVLDRHVWRGDGISRAPEDCVVLRPDVDGGWEIKNRAPEMVVILHDGHHRYDLVTGMSLALHPGVWRGSLAGVFAFAVTSERPDAPVRPVGERLLPVSQEQTRRGSRILRARAYLDKHPHKRDALAMLWNQHLVLTRDIAADLPPARVGRAFGVEAKLITRWREDLAEYVFEERGHQGLIRDVVVKHGVMSREDVELAKRSLADRHRRSP